MPDSNDPNLGGFSSPQPATPAGEVPQFSTAEYGHSASQTGAARCRICGQLLPSEYYRVNGQMACVVCARQGYEGQPLDSHVAFARGLALGVGAAVLGLALYAAFTIATHFYFGYIALGVGWLVAKAILKGSGGIGGQRYQIVAVLLTYAAISLAAIPIGLARIFSHGAPHIDIVSILPRLLWVGLASPFLGLRDPIHGLIGLVILFVGLRIAWRLTAARRLSVDGPYPLGA